MRTRTAAALAASVAALALSTPPAAASPDPATAASVRGAHFSPDTPTVDVYLTSFAGGTTTLALSDVGYGDVSDYQRIEPGLYTVGMRPAGADPSTPAVISWTLDAKPGQAFTACAIGMSDALQGRVLTDDLTAAPPNQARVRVIQAASQAPKSDIIAENGPVFGDEVPFGTTTDYVNVSAGTWPVTAQASDDEAQAITTDITLRPASLNTVLLLDTPEKGIQLQTLSDGIGPYPVPTGPIEAGDAALTETPLFVPAIVLTGLALTTTLVLLGFTLRRTH